MSNKYNKSLVKNSQCLRKGMTDEEKHLWYDFLRYLPVTVNRQKVIENYIVDFYIFAKKIVIELDGSQHGKEENHLKDETRDKVLHDLEINTNFDSVCRDILKNLDIPENEFIIYKQHLS